MTFREDKKVQDFIVNRKLTAPVLLSPPSAAKNHQLSETDIDFKGEIMNLEVQQVNKQSSFA